LDRIDLTTALGRLLCSRSLRREFARSPIEAAHKIGICETDHEAFLNLNSESIESQAQRLIQKRLFEVSRLLPATFRLGGTQSIIDFEDYAEAHWPQGHRRHLNDAAEFCRYLESNCRPLCRSEHNRVRFAAQKNNFRIHLVRRAALGSKQRCAVQILLRLRNSHLREFALHMAW
jgi:hypothetical protein